MACSFIVLCNNFIFLILETGLGLTYSRCLQLLVRLYYYLRRHNYALGCPLSPTLFNIYLKNLMKNCFLNTGSVNIGGRKIKCIRFVDDMALLTEDERTLKNMLMDAEEDADGAV